MRYLVSAVAALAVCSGVAAARPMVNTFRDTLNIPFTPGTGNSNTNFAISRDGNTGYELGLKAKERFFGDANVGGSGSLYTVNSGYSPVSNSNPTLDPPRAWWNFDFSIDIGSNTFATTTVNLTITNTINSLTLSIPVSALITGAGFGGLSVWQGSENLGFGAFGPLGFNALQQGDYLFSLVAFNSGVVSARTDMTVRVVPLPTGAGLGMAGMMILAGVRRRR